MKPTLLTLSFLLFAFPLAFSSNDVELVLDSLDVNGNPILPDIVGPPRGGVKPGINGNSRCPVTVLQDYLEVNYDFPVKFSIPGVNTAEILTGTPLEIELTKRPDCAASSKWMVFVDDEIQKAFVGIGSPQDHPGQQAFSGTFSIQKYKFEYNLVFSVAGSPACLILECKTMVRVEGV